MGRKGKWITAVKRVFSPDPKEKKKPHQKSKRRWVFGSCTDVSCTEPLDDTPAPEEVSLVHPPPPPPRPKTPLAKEIKTVETVDEQSKHAYSIALASAVAAEAAVAAAQAAAEVVRLTTSTRFSGRSREEAAAIIIQSAFRGYLARRALRALRGLVRLKTIIHSSTVKNQTANTLRCMQTMARVQAQIRSRRTRMTEENQALQRQMQLKHERELEKLRMGEEWDDSLQTKEQIEASLMNKQEASIRRERALAYAFSHQWKSSSRSVNAMFMDPNNPTWGWSWLERWMAARPWEGGRSATDNDHPSVRSVPRSTEGEIAKAYARRDSTSSRPTSRHSLSTPSYKASSVSSRIKLASPRGGGDLTEDDSRSMLSLQSGRHRRHSIGGSSVRDDESLASSPSIPSYMSPTQSAKAKSRFQTPLSENKIETPRASVGSTRKRLSFPVPDKQTTRRHSGPPKVDIASLNKV